MTTDYPANHLTGAVAGIVPLKGNLYAFSDHICRIITARGQIEALRLPVSSVSGAGYDALRKEFVLLGHDRISTIRSRALAKRHSPVPLLLSSVRVNDSIDWQAWHNATEQKTLKLHHNENDFVFSFTDLPYADRMRNVYAYRLKGLEEAWHPLGDDMQTAFTRVPAGDYELEVAVADGLSRPVDIVYHVVVEVLHPWYATTWMKLLYAALVMFLIWTGYRGYRHFSSLRREKHLHDSILVQMERRHRYIDYVAEELKKADAQILMALQNFSNKDNTPQQRYAIGQIRKRASQIGSLVRQTFNQKQGRQAPLPNAITTNVDVLAFCRQTVDMLEEQSQQRHIDMALPVSDNAEEDLPVVNTDIIRLDAILSIIYNFLLADSGEKAVIATTVRLEEGRIAIRISTDKPRMDNKSLTMIFKQDAAKRPIPSQGNDRMALYLSKVYAEELGGEMKASFTDKGSLVFCLLMPASEPSVKGAAQRSGKSSKIRAAASLSAKQQERKENTKADDDQALIKRFTAIIEKHIMDDNLSVATILHEMGVGNKFLYRKVKTVTGYSPVEYIRKVRMERAAYLLKKGSTTSLR